MLQRKVADTQGVQSFCVYRLVYTGGCMRRWGISSRRCAEDAERFSTEIARETQTKNDSANPVNLVKRYSLLLSSA